MGIADMLIGGFESGTRLRQNREAEQKQKGIAGLYQQAYNAPVDQQRTLVTQAMGLDPQAGMALNQGLSADNESRAHRLVGMAQAITQTPEEMRPQMYAKMLPELRQLGVPAGDQYDPSIMDAAKQILTAAYGPDASAAPSGYQEFDMLARDANLSPEDRALAARRQLYLDPRPSSAAIQYKEVVGADGRTRMVALDPREVGAQVVGGGQPYGSAVQAGGDPFAFLSQAGAQVTSGQRSPEHNAKVGGVPNSYHLTGQARDILPPRDPQQAAFIREQAAANGLEVIDEGDHWHLEPRPGQQGASPFVSRRPEDEAAAKRLAEGRADLSLAPAQAQAEADKTRMVETEKERVKARSELPKAIQQAELMLDTISKLEKHPGLSIITGMSGVLDPRNYLRGTAAQGAQALADQITGQTFLQAYQTLKGGGQITEVEGKKAEAAMARLNTAQSEEDFLSALGDLREVIESGRARAKAYASGDRPSNGDSTPSNDVSDLLQKYGVR